MDIFSVLTLIGGLVLFLYGMNVMSQGLERLAGGKLEKLFDKLTSNPFKGFLLGFSVTAIIQSSSATTVMLVGFVNSGIMKLRQSISIIMGANIGTAVTAWILSLTGIEGGSFWLEMLKPSSFTPILALIGIICYMFLKEDKYKYIGSILLGFTVLMFGMDTMSGAVEPLQDMPEFSNMLLMFDNPILGILVGAVLTAVIQSSSASVGILQALSSTGAVRFSTALPIILGQNIGTCITAVLSAIGTNKNAKRVAIIHLLFNIIGTVLCVVIYYPLNAVFEFAFASMTVDALDIAIIHTLFKVATTVVLFPFIGALEKMSYLIIRDKKTDEDDLEQAPVIDERFMSTPSFALAQCKTHMVKMAKLAKKNIMDAISLVRNWDKVVAQKIAETEKAVDKYEDVLGTYLVKLSGQEMSQQDSRTASTILHTISDLERISDHAKNICASAKELHDKKLTLSKKAQSELDVLFNAIEEILDLTVTAVRDNDLYSAYLVEPLEEVVDQLRTKLKSRHIKRLQKGTCSMETGFIYIDLLTSLERVSDHCSNVAVCLIQVSDDNFETHEYLRTVKTSGEEFDMYVAKYLDKYTLPKKV
ncbi:MAG: Na/Pi cotransporter family protein [Ruminococcus sp.]|nr:Na/Pi cotransporter family protein [Ruminococcus sp.]